MNTPRIAPSIRSGAWTIGVLLLVSACNAKIGGDGSAAPVNPAAGGTTGTGGAGTGGSSVAASDCKADAPPSAGVGRWRRLTAAQYRSTIADLLKLDADTGAFLQDSKTGAFSTNADLPLASGDVDAYQTSAEKLAASTVKDLPGLLGGCDPQADGEDACAARFIDDFGSRAYRHALTDRQKQALNTVYVAGKADGFARGIQLVVEAALQAPEFLYLVEVGDAQPDGLFALDDYELASRLSYLLTGSMPDASLFGKAKAGQLKDPAALVTEATRLLDDPRFITSVTAFHNQLFRVERLGQPGVVSKDPADAQTFNDALRASMVNEASELVRYVFASGSGTIKSLLTAPVAFPDAALAPLYGLRAAPAGGRFDVQDGTRSGFLTLPAVMAAVPPLPTRHQAVMRGNMIRRELLCNAVPPPNVAVNFALPPNADQLSNQELLRMHKDNPSCSGCHELMDPIGFGFESFDGLGRFATTAHGESIDTTGYVAGLDGGKPEFNGAVELSHKLADSPTVRACLATQWFRYSLARDPHAGDECSLAAMQTVLTTGDGDVKQAILTLVQSPAFRLRRGT